jgi:hypothetical protein
MRPNPYRRPLPRQRVAHTRHTASLPYEMAQPIESADNALNEAHNYLTQLARELEWLPPSSPNANDVARIQMLIRKASEEIYILDDRILEAIEKECY